MRCCRCGRFTSRVGRAWVFTSRYRVTDESRRTWGPGFDPIHITCLRKSTR
jgi:hypothetical protein